MKIFNHGIVSNTCVKVSSLLKAGDDPMVWAKNAAIELGWQLLTRQPDKQCFKEGNQKCEVFLCQLSIFLVEPVKVLKKRSHCWRENTSVGYCWNLGNPVTERSDIFRYWNIVIIYSPSQVEHQVCPEKFIILILKYNISGVGGWTLRVDDLLVSHGRSQKYLFLDIVTKCEEKQGYEKKGTRALTSLHAEFPWRRRRSTFQLRQLPSSNDTAILA